MPIEFNGTVPPFKLIASNLHYNFQMNNLDRFLSHQNGDYQMPSTLQLKLHPQMVSLNRLYATSTTSFFTKDGQSSNQVFQFKDHENAMGDSTLSQTTPSFNIESYLTSSICQVQKKPMIRSTIKLLSLNKSQQTNQYFQNEMFGRLEEWTGLEKKCEVLQDTSNSILEFSKNKFSGMRIYIFVQRGFRLNMCNVSFFSSSGQLLILARQLESCQKLKSCLLKINNCFCIIYNTTGQDLESMIKTLRESQNLLIYQYTNMEYMTAHSLMFLPIQTDEMKGVLASTWSLLASNTPLYQFYSTNYNSILIQMGSITSNFIKALGIIKMESSCMNTIKAICLAYNISVQERVQITSKFMIQTLFKVLNFLQKKVNVQDQLQNKRLQNEIGCHYPLKMSFCLKCRVCRQKNSQKRNKTDNSKKSKYVCEGCSNYFGEKVHLCVVCFKKFHSKILFFMKKKGHHHQKPSRARRVKKSSEDDNSKIFQNQRSSHTSSEAT